MPFRVEGSAANIGDGPYGAVGLLLAKRGTQTIDAVIAVHLERAGTVHGIGPPRHSNR